MIKERIENKYGKKFLFTCQEGAKKLGSFWSKHFHSKIKISISNRNSSSQCQYPQFFWMGMMGTNIKYRLPMVIVQSHRPMELVFTVIRQPTGNTWHALFQVGIQRIIQELGKQCLLYPPKFYLKVMFLMFSSRAHNQPHRKITYY